MRDSVNNNPPKTTVASGRCASEPPHRDFLSESTAQRKFNTLSLGPFAALALLLALAGIYGVIAYAVTLRTYEIGVSTALGTRPSDALKLIISQGMTPALIGVGIELLVSV